MKRKTTLLFFFLAFSSMILIGQEKIEENKNTITATITISGMACQEGCADAIAKNLLETIGVDSAEVSYETSKAIVKFDRNVTAIKTVEEVITATKVKDYVYTIEEVTLKNKL